MPLVPTTNMADAHKYSVSGNYWTGEPHDLLKTMSAFEFRPAFFGADSKTCIFYKYVIFKYSIFFSNLYCSTNTLSPVWLSYSPTDVKSHKMDKPHRHSFLQNTLTMRLFPASETPTVTHRTILPTMENHSNILNVSLHILLWI